MAKLIVFFAVEIALWVTPMIWPAIPFGIGMLFYGVAIGLCVAAAIFYWSDKEIKDVEVVALRRDVCAIKDGLSQYRFNSISDDINDRYQRLRDSDHLVWQVDKISSLRSDFLNRAGRLLQDMLDLKKGMAPIEDAAEREETMKDMRKIATKLDKFLSTSGS